MSIASQSRQTHSQCKHKSLVLESSSPHASTAGYRRPTAKQRAAACTPRGRVHPGPKCKRRGGSDSADNRPAGSSKLHLRDAEALVPDSASFPAPLVLPGDELAQDPRCPPQSLRAWLRSKDRNERTCERNAIYVAAPPSVAPCLEFIDTWSQPQGVDDKCKAASSATNPASYRAESTRAESTYAENTTAVTPRVQDVIDYLSAFYHGIPVKSLPPVLSFAIWEEDLQVTGEKVKIRPESFIGLGTTTECVRIRTRFSRGGPFTHQLNSDDLLDVAVSVLPDDAYALVLLVMHDLFESDEDDFMCGRAYGGSRVAVVSMARYNPILDSCLDVERQHSWPASHCGTYVNAYSSIASRRRNGRSKGKGTAIQCPELPLYQALSAHNASPVVDSCATTHALSGLWLGRACRTTSHELGHCFGIEHCVYYACVMQGSASLPEDARQPPYLCPVDLSKLVRITGETEEQHHAALLSFCDQHKDIHMFAAFAAWIRSLLAETSALV